MIRKVTGKTFRVIDDVQKQDYMATLGSIQGREITSVDWSKFCEGIKNRQLLCNKFAIAMFALHSFISNPRHGYLILHILIERIGHNFIEVTRKTKCRAIGATQNITS